MRIIAGKFRSRSLKTPRGALTRPSTDRVREALFSMVQSRLDLDEARVLDLFSGTGALGLEALSRGAGSAWFVEASTSVLRLARQNAELLGVDAQCRFVLDNAVNFVKRYAGGQFDLIVADPPYDLEEVPELPSLVLPLLAADGLFVLEHDARNRFPEGESGHETTRSYGRTKVTIFRPVNAPRSAP